MKNILIFIITMIIVSVFTTNQAVITGTEDGEAQTFVAIPGSSTFQ